MSLLVVELDDFGAVAHVLSLHRFHFVKCDGSNPARCHGSVSICPVAGAGFSNEVNDGICLKRKRLASGPGRSRTA